MRSSFSFILLASLLRSELGWSWVPSGHNAVRSTCRLDVFPKGTKLFSVAPAEPSMSTDSKETEKKNPSSSNKDYASQRVTLTRFLSGIVQDEPELRDMESLLLSVQMACKTISNLVNRAGIHHQVSSMESNISEDVRLKSMKRLDQLSTAVLRNALRYTGKLSLIKAAKDDCPYGEEEGPLIHQPGVLIASGLDNKYVACFDPLDGSGNADATICTGTVFGVFETNDDATSSEEEDEGVDNVVVGGGDGIEVDDGVVMKPTKPSDNLVKAVLQPGKNLRAAGYCLYSSATILVFTLGDGTHGFTLDPQINEFVLTHPNIRIPQRGNVYSCNEANSEGWDQDLKKYVKALKTGDNETKQRYALRYVGSMAGDIHRTLMYGGIFFYPSDNDLHPHGNLQLLYKISPMSYIIDQAGGKCTNGKTNLLNVTPQRVHERSPCFIGSPENINEMKQYIPHND